MTVLTVLVLWLVSVPVVFVLGAVYHSSTQSGRTDDLVGRDDTPALRERLKQARAERDAHG